MLPPSPLYSDVLNDWYDEHKLHIMESTAYNYRKALPIVQEYFDGILVNDITPDMVHKYVQHLLKCYKPSCARLYCKVLQLSLQYAVRYRYITYNPSSMVLMPRAERTEIKIYRPEEISLLLSVDTPDWVRDGIIIAYRTGMRPGEIYALKWSDINFAQKYISVQRAVSRACSSAKTTKTPSGVRRIDIDSKLTTHLMLMRDKADPKCKYLFPPPPRGNHEYRVPWNISKYVQTMCRAAGIPDDRTFYSFRHTHASILLEAGVHPKIVQERLGHSSFKITMDIYSHLAPTIQRRAVEAMENIKLL